MAERKLATVLFADLVGSTSDASGGCAYLEPFALRALGSVRDDARLFEEAAARFESLGLAWHAGETRRLT